MGRSDCCINQGKEFIRVEDQGEVEIITTHKITHFGKKDYPTTCIRWRGLHTVHYGDETFLADETMTFDSGPKMGVSVLVCKHREVPYTEEECEAGRQRIKQVATECLIKAGVW